MLLGECGTVGVLVEKVLVEMNGEVDVVIAQRW
jgi:hypothetical protein